MNRIRLLPEQVANQIAAGEVVERPASVVKELVENALDAQASRIAVDIQGGGRSLIRVTDDGLGMSRDDALLSLERHATSKIRRAEDLSAIQTLGFRGEALPSIASVSRLVLTTRERDADSPEATQIVLQGGKILEVKAAGAPPGTTLEVRQLFFNLPARRKFLRSQETETAHIHHYLTLVALAFPEVAFTFLCEARTVWQLPAVKLEAGLAALRERLRALYGAELKLLAVDAHAQFRESADREDHDALPSPAPASPALVPTRLWGFIGAPGVSRATREDQHLFVNRRPVEHRGLNYALLEGYHTILMKGRYPVGALFLEIPPAAVDVNIHPAKREVKFHDERAVRQFVTQAIRKSLVHFHAAPGGAKEPGPPPAEPRARLPLAAPVARSEAPRQMPLAAPSAPPLAVSAEPLFPSPPPLLATAPSEAVSAPPPLAALPLPERPSPPAPAAPAGTERPGPDDPTPLLRIPLRVIGVVGKLYLVLESDQGLVLLDQHAAHERILFEQLLSRLTHGPAPSQRLLLPETVELSARDADFVRRLLPTLTRLGVGLNEFGERTFLLDALPPFVRVREARGFVLGLVDELKAAGSDVNPLRLGEETVAKTVCRQAVKANDPLAGPELEQLLHDLRQCAMPYTCPHGRPTLIEMNYRELEKKFGRQQ